MSKVYLKVHLIGSHRNLTLCGQGVHYYFTCTLPTERVTRKRSLSFTEDPSKVTCKSCDNIHRYK